MNVRLRSNWAGSLSAGWMLGGYVLIRYVTVPHGLVFKPFWLYALTLFCVWLGVGLVIATAGLQCRSLAGRASTLLAILLFIFFTCCMLYPVFKPARLRASSSP